MRKLLPVLLCCAALLSCKEGRKLTRIDISEYSSDAIVALDDRYDKWFGSYSAVVLENTGGTDIVRDGAVIGHDGKVLVIMDGEVRIFETSTGKDAGRIIPGGGKYVSMDLDTLSGMLYALDSARSRIDRIRPSGDVCGSIHLDERHVYDKIVLLDEGTLLVMTSGFSGRETFLVDVAGSHVSALDIPEKNLGMPSEAVRDSIRALGLPLWTVCGTWDGDVLVKYLFEDIVYKYDRSGSTPMYMVADDGVFKYSGKGLRMRGKKQSWLTGMWQIGNGLWLVRYKEYWNNLLLSAFAICNSDMTLYNNTVTYNSSRMWWAAPGLNVYDIRPDDIITVQPDERRIYRLKAYSESVKVPPGMRQSLEEDGMILGIFDLK